LYTQYIDKYGMPKIANEEELKTVGAFQKSELQRNKTFYLD